MIPQIYLFLISQLIFLILIYTASVNRIIQDNADKLNAAIVFDRDFQYNFFGFKTLERSYLLKINGKPAERPQHLLMRVSVGMHQEDLDAAIETYNLLSEKWLAFERTGEDSELRGFTVFTVFCQLLNLTE